MSREIIQLDIDDLVRKYLNGYSENRLAKLYSINRWTIRNRLEKAQIEIRTQSEAEKLKWSQMPKEQRQRQVSAAHIACKGRNMSWEEKIKRANTRQQRGILQSPLEILFWEYIQSRNFIMVPQQAIGPYNCDFGASPISMEIFGGNWHMTGRRGQQKRKAIRYFLNSGWHCYIIVVDKRRSSLSTSVADDVIAYIEQMRSNPPSCCEYRVVSGTGELITRGSGQDNDISFKPSTRCGRDSRTGRYISIAK